MLLIALFFLLFRLRLFQDLKSFFSSQFGQFFEFNIWLNLFQLLSPCVNLLKSLGIFHYFSNSKLLSIILRFLLNWGKLEKRYFFILTPHLIWFLAILNRVLPVFMSIKGSVNFTESTGSNYLFQFSSLEFPSFVCLLSFKFLSP